MHKEVQLKENQKLNQQIINLKEYLREGMNNGTHLVITTDILSTKGLLYLVDEVAREFCRKAVYLADDLTSDNFKNIVSLDTLIVLEPSKIQQAKELEQMGYQLVLASSIENYYINHGLISV